MIALLRCKRSSTKVTDDDASLTTRRHDYDNTLTPNIDMDMSVLTAKFQDENESLMT